MIYSVLAPLKLVEDNSELIETGETETEWAGAYLNYLRFFSEAWESGEVACRAMVGLGVLDLKRSVLVP